MYANTKPKKKEKRKEGCDIPKGTNFSLIKDTGSTAQGSHILPELLMPLFQRDITELTRGNTLHLENRL